MVKLVLFDIDGTLIRSGGAGVKAFAKAFATEFGINDGSEKLKFAGRTDISIVREFFLHNKIEPSPENFEKYFTAYLSHLETIIRECEGEVCSGVLDFLNQLRTLREPPVLGLLTGNIRRGAQIKLGRYNLWRQFSTGAFADDHEERDEIAAIAKQRGIEIVRGKIRDPEVLVIGDTDLDIRCARAINAKVLAVATGTSTKEELLAFRPDWAVEDLTKISAAEVCA